MKLDKNELLGLRQLYENDVLWARFEAVLKREEESCVNNILKVEPAPERYVGRLKFIRELLQLRENAKEVI